MIEVIDLKKVFDNGFEALKSVNFTIEKGDLVCLLGPSGCGKSTILNLISGLLTPSAGDIRFAGNSVIETEPKDRNIGFVFQNYALYPHMTVEENIMFPLTVGAKKISKAEAKEIAKEYMALTNIEELKNKKPGTLSGGQQQRVAITRALVQKPEVLLLDEPLSNLDARLRLKIREEIRRLVKEVGITTIFVTHDQEEALSISDKIILLNEGIIQQDDDPQNLYLEPNNLFVAEFIGNPIINILPVEVKNGVMYYESMAIPVANFVSNRFKTDMPDGNYHLGIRPEDVLPADSGVFTTTVHGVELIGRERILNFEVGSKRMKSIVSIETGIEEGTVMSFDFAYHKAFIFNENGERIY
ncbi:ABC transporter ATP-binding protein [Enterococcus phoeniculicola]|jgi:multiple sugar transport system ATP-binding protein|uniref:ABC transporter ATP-binding protein n=1 Tax=Enterococcus phoeniculicola ATCC BAA-412 TaxID=1158610 RepID=R3W897_9ENTE|nr:ABC transporter ATP-binding protein [Enterococcus phoeniculicola]EOL44011.1 ABC transporter ATP-binding protein [Enterococcus phoeniculicola ATCC BAA-412]EOT75113.1 ABC transporter ATP-binding protein [Enterococcus phoeniculicola ATCC BAA-412]OJG71560.1 ABC transporter ATP-binding protein [Enterococcus phoeniculicola]